MPQAVPGGQQAPRDRPSHAGEIARTVASRLALGLALSWSFALMADREDSGWMTLTAENNNFVVNQDRHYVNGGNLAYLSPALAPDRGPVAAACADLEDALPLLFTTSGKERDRRFEWTMLGQQLFTPTDRKSPIPDPRDRPYAGWLYTSLSLFQDTDRRRLDDLTATIGVVGPLALGSEVQNGFHRIFGFGRAQGWNHQIRNEPGLLLAYSRKWRFGATAPATGGLGGDLVPELGATVGNVLTYGEATLLARVGWGLDSSFGPRLIQPGLTGGGYFNSRVASAPWSVYAFLGLQERAVAHNIFLDGNSYQGSPSVDRYPWVHDEALGLSAQVGQRLRVDFTYVRRSEEFRGQHGDDHYGSISIAAPF